MQQSGPRIYPGTINEALHMLDLTLQTPFLNKPHYQRFQHEVESKRRIQEPQQADKTS